MINCENGSVEISSCNREEAVGVWSSANVFKEETQWLTPKRPQSSAWMPTAQVHHHQELLVVSHNLYQRFSPQLTGATSILRNTYIMHPRWPGKHHRWFWIQSKKRPFIMQPRHDGSVSLQDHGESLLTLWVCDGTLMGVMDGQICSRRWYVHAVIL